MIPSTLKDKLKRLSWFANDESTSFQYAERRLFCKDGIKTMLTPTFFTQLQVLFFIYLCKLELSSTSIFLFDLQIYFN